jgi:hypothetical protein
MEYINQITGINYVAFNCQPSNEVRGNNRKASKPPCQKWSFKTTRENMDNRTKHQSKPQGKCSYCGNRPRLSIESVMVFETREEAEYYCEVNNR